MNKEVFRRQDADSFQSAIECPNGKAEHTNQRDILTEMSPDKAEAVSTEEVEPWEFISGIQLYTVMSAVTVTTFLTMLDTSILVTAIPRITNEFNSLSDVGWYGSSYLLALCVLQPLTGKLYSHLNSKYFFIFFLALFELGSLLCGVSKSSKMLIVGRAVAGLGCSGIFNGALTIIAACVPLEKRASYIGVMLGSAQIAVLTGPMIGGSLAQYTTWRWCFYLNLPAGAVVACFILLTSIPQQNTISSSNMSIRSILESLDLLGFALFSPSAIMLLLAIEWGGVSYPWNSATVIGLICGAGVTLLIFLTWEHRRGETAMIPLPMLRKKVVWSSCLTQFFYMASMYIMPYYLPIYFQTTREASPTLSGVYMLPGIGSVIMFAIISGVLVGRLGYYLPWIIASAIIQTIGSGLISTLNPISTASKWVGYQLINGIGRGCGIQIPIIALQNFLDPNEVAVGMALAIFCQNFGGALFLSFAQSIFSASLSDALHTFTPELDASLVISSGATAFRDTVPEASIPGVLLAYSQALSHVFYLATAGGVMTFFCCWGMGWKSVGKVKSSVPGV